MKKRILGRTGLEVSVIGMGGIPIQRVDKKEANLLIKAAIEKGINFFDTARAYTDSEEKFGAGFSGHTGQIVATKSMARDKEAMSKDVETSLHNLGVKSIDIFQLHNVKDEQALQKVLAPEGALTALKQAQNEGKIRFIGITGHIPKILVQALKTGEFDTVQFPYNPVEREAEQELIPLAQEMNVGMIAMKPLAGGAFKNSSAAIRFILNSPVTTVIPGIDSLAHVEVNASLGYQLTPLTAREKLQLEQEVAELGNRFCRRCEYCQPCPQGIDIPMIFLLDGYWTRYGLQDWAVDRYKPLTNKASACIDCGLCEEKCPYSLPIRQMLKESGQHLEG